MVLIIKETKEEIQFNNDFEWMFNKFEANLPATPPIIRENFLNFKRILRNEVIKKWIPKSRVKDTIFLCTRGAGGVKKDLKRS